MNNLVQVNFHGVLQELGKTWNLAVNSVGEAVRAINTIKKGRLNKTLLENDKKGIRYRVLINGRDFLSEEIPTLENPQTITNSELCFKFPANKLKTIDFIPVLEGAKDVFLIILGVIILIIGLYYGSPELIVVGLSLIAGGVMLLLSKPPAADPFQDFTINENTKLKSSYLFNGPENVIREGGPVPILYGRLLVGSQVVSASYEITDKRIGEVGITI